MVLIHVKGKAEDQQFLFETTTGISCDDLTNDITKIHNGRLRICRLAASCAELIEHGPAKNPKEHGLDEYMPEEQFKKMTLDGEESRVPLAMTPEDVYRPDDLGKRTGVAPNHEKAEIIKNTLTDALNAIDKKNVDLKRPLTLKVIEDSVDCIRGAIMIVYPMGLPEWDEVRLNLEYPDEDPSGGQGSLDIIEANGGSLWWAGKQFAREKTLGDYVGKNEKTKIVAKLQKKGQGAPAREPMVDAQTQKEMMAFYHKKQEELKKLQENDDDQYLNSAWANPKALKHSLHGGSDVKWRPIA